MDTLRRFNYLKIRYFVRQKMVNHQQIRTSPQNLTHD